MLVPNASKVGNGGAASWSEDDDLELLVQVLEQDVETDKNIDFYDIDNGRSPQENSYRWTILLKGLGGFMPGQKVRVKEVVPKLIKDIQTKSERYVPWSEASNSKGGARNGKNQYINIVEYFRKHFQ